MNDRPNPYVGPRPLKEGEALYGRSRELQRLTNLLLAERIVLLYSPSGAGKTSLIQAGLIPQLQEEGFRILGPMRPGAVATSADGSEAGNRYVAAAIASLEEALVDRSRRAARDAAEDEREDSPPVIKPSEQEAPREAASLPFEERLETLASALAPRPVAPQAGEEAGPVWSGDLLVFDQFEEVLLADPTDHAGRLDFFEQLGAVLRRRDRWALFAMREEHLAALDSYRRPIPTHFATTFRLDLLDLAGAEEAIRGPAEAEGVEFPEEIAQSVAQDLARVRRPAGTLSYGGPAQSGQWIEPVQLQVVCQRIWEALDSDEAAISSRHLTEIGDVDTALREYYAASVAKAAEEELPERALREWLGSHLITASGARNQVLWETGPETAALDRALEKLANAHLLRAEQRRDALWLELSHDRLVEPVQDDNADWLAKHLQPFQYQAQAWERTGRPAGMLLRGPALRDALTWAGNPNNAAELTGHQDEADFVKESRKAWITARRNRALIASLVGVMLLAALVAFYVTERNNRLAVAQFESRRLAAASIFLLDGEPQQALLAAAAAQQNADTVEARGSLITVLSPERRPAAVFNTKNLPFDSVAYSLQGTQLAGAADNGEVYVWDAATAGERWVLSPSVPAGPAHHVAYSTDGRLLAVGYQSGRIPIYDLEGALPQQVSEAETDDVLNGLAMSRGDVLYTAGEESVTVWRVERGNVATQLVTRDAPDVRDLALSPDGLKLVTAHGTGAVWEWSTPAEEGGLAPAPQNLLQGPPSTARAVAIAWDGSIAAGFADGQVVWWPPAPAESSDRRYRLLGLHERGVNALAFAPRGSSSENVPQLASAGNDRQVILWDPLAGGAEATWRGHSGFANDVVFSPAGDLVISAGDDGVYAWATGETAGPLPSLARVLTRHSDKLYSATIRSTGRGTVIAAGGRDGAIRLWRPDGPASGAILATLPDSQVRAVALNDDGTRLAAIDDAQRLRVWPLDGATPPVERTHAADKRLTSVLFLGDVVVTGLEAVAGEARPDQGGEVDVWAIDEDQSADPQPLEKVRVALPVIALAGSASVPRVITDDAAPRGPVRALYALAPDGTILIVEWRPADRTLSGVEMIGVNLGGDAAASLAVSSDGVRWAIGTGHGAIAMGIFPGERRQESLVTLRDHVDEVTGVAFSPDGRMLASSSKDGSLRLWDVATGQPLGEPLRSTGSSVNSVQFSDDGRWLAATTDDGALIVYEAEPAEWVRLACRLFGRPVTGDDVKLQNIKLTPEEICAQP